MKIGIIGATSNIAGKAYLPVYAGLQDAHDFVIYSREIEKAEAIQKRYHFAAATANLSELESCQLVMIHAATSEHYALAEHFLSAGVHVFVDKPVSENFEEVQALQQIAADKNVLFIVGFNRRFAPLTQKLKAVKDKNLIAISKNQADNAADLKYTLYDVFIHPLDTLIYLLDDEILDARYRLFKDDDGKLKQILVTLQTPSTIGMASMNLLSGAFTEDFRVESLSGTYTVKELENFQKVTGRTAESEDLTGWMPATARRGFDKMIEESLSAVAAFDGNNREQLQEQLLQSTVLQSHAIIDYILSEEGDEK